ncbi:MAG TPA: hypothetical protein VJP83_00195 [Terriglobales bacterium]|nr:hypothetical protein [Terriglobales bacterium]
MARRQLGQAKIQNLHPPLAGDEYVFRLQVAMDNAFVVSRSQPGCDLRRIFHCLACGQRSTRQPMAQAFSFQQLADNIKAVRLRAYVIHGDNVRMVEGGGSARLLFKAAHTFRVEGVLRRQKLDGDGPLQACIPRAINLPHAAGAKRRNDLVRPERCAGGERHKWAQL